jgi:hypothetical protein
MKVEATKAEADKCKLHQKIFCCQELEQEIVEFLPLGRKTRVPVTCEAQELAKSHKFMQPLLALNCGGMDSVFT